MMVMLVMLIVVVTVVVVVVLIEIWNLPGLRDWVPGKNLPAEALHAVIAVPSNLDMVMRIEDCNIFDFEREKTSTTWKTPSREAPLRPFFADGMGVTSLHCIELASL